MAVVAHFWKDGIDKVGLDIVTLHISEKCMVERVREGWFVIDLVYQIRIEARHG